MGACSQLQGLSVWWTAGQRGDKGVGEREETKALGNRAHRQSSTDRQAATSQLSVGLGQFLTSWSLSLHV